MDINPAKDALINQVPRNTASNIAAKFVVLGTWLFLDRASLG